MAGQRLGETGLSESGPSSHHVPYGVLHGINTSASGLMNQGSGFDFGELEEAFAPLQGIKIRSDEAKSSALFTGRPSATLEMFPSWPMRFHQTPRGGSKSGGESTDSGSGVNTLSSKNELQFETESPISIKASSSDHQQAFDQLQQQQQQETATDGSRAGTSQTQSQQEKVLKTTIVATVNLSVSLFPCPQNTGKVDLFKDNYYYPVGWSFSLPLCSHIFSAQIPTALRKSKRHRVSLIPERFSDECLT